MFQHPTTTTCMVPPQPQAHPSQFIPSCTASSRRRARITTGSPTKTQPGGLPRTFPSSLAKLVATLGATECFGRDSYTADCSIKPDGEAQRTGVSVSGETEPSESGNNSRRRQELLLPVDGVSGVAGVSDFVWLVEVLSGHVERYSVLMFDDGVVVGDFLGGWSDEVGVGRREYGECGGTPPNFSVALNGSSPKPPQNHLWLFVGSDLTRWNAAAVVGRNMKNPDGNGPIGSSPELIMALGAAIDAARSSDEVPVLDLESLGLDSLTSIEVLHSLKQSLDLEINPESLQSCHTVAELELFISGAMQKSSPVNQALVPTHSLSSSSGPTADSNDLTKMLNMEQLPVPLHRGEGNGKSPLFLIHDGSGLCNYYSKQTSLERAVFGIYNPRFFDERQWAGWSYGGVVAFEAERQLLAQNRPVAGILLIDSPHL
ncbi:polyketide beta-ketoacyl-synthase, partial [Rhizina undulata]